MALGRWRPVRIAQRWVQVCGLQCWTEDLFGEGLGLPANEVCGFGCAFEVPVIVGSRSPGGVEDVSHAVHEEWAPRVPECMSAFWLKREGGKFNRWQNEGIFVKSRPKITLQHSIREDRINQRNCYIANF